MNIFASPLLPLLAAIMIVVSFASLCFAHEGIRGAGRVVLGVGILVLGNYFLPGMGSTDASYLVAGLFIASGVGTIFMGVRKYLRR